MKNRIKTMFLVCVLSGQVVASDKTILYGRYEAIKKKIAEKVKAVKDTGSRIVVSAKKHPLIAMWGLVGTLIIIEQVHKTIRQIEQNRLNEVRWAEEARQNEVRLAEEARQNEIEARQNEIIATIFNEQPRAVELAQARKVIQEGELNRLIGALNTELPSSTDRGQREQCPLCQEMVLAKRQGEGEINLNGMISLHCSHSACHNCLRGTVLSGLHDGTSNRKDINASLWTCPDTSCRAAMTVADVQRIAGSSLLESYVIASQPNGKHCPTRDCSYVFIPQEGLSTFECPECSGCYCVSCLINHDSQAISCEVAKRIKEGGDDPRNKEWLATHTKKCPNLNCKVAIEKNDGCLHMTCRKCQHNFCWNCLGSWPHAHGDAYSCGFYRLPGH